MLEKNSSSVFNKNSEERRKYLTKVLFVGFFLVIAIAAGLVAFLRKESMQIRAVQIVGTEALDPNELNAAALEYLSGNRMGLIPKSNTLLFSKTRMMHFLLKRFAGLHTVQVAFENKNEITVTVQEKKPKVVGCVGTECFFLDNQGIAYKQAPIFSDGVFMTFTRIDGEVQVLGKSFLAPGNFDKFQLMTDQLHAMQVRPVEIMLDDQITIRVDRILDHDVSPETKIILTQDTTSDDMVTALRLLFTDKGFLAQLQAHPENLEYIDVRFPGKMYYKFISP